MRDAIKQALVAYYSGTQARLERSYLDSTIGMVRIARRAHLRYWVYLRPWVCRAFGVATHTLLVAPLYGIYVVARWLGLWPGIPGTEDGA